MVSDSFRASVSSGEERGEPGEPDMENVERLEKAIEKDCWRLDARNHIVGVISQGDLHDAIRASGLSNGAFLNNTGNDYPVLVFSGRKGSPTFIR